MTTTTHRLIQSAATTKIPNQVVTHRERDNINDAYKRLAAANYPSPYRRRKAA